MIKEESEEVTVGHGEGKRNIQRFRIDEDRGPWFGRQRDKRTVKEGARDCGGYYPIPIQTVRVRDDTTVWRVCVFSNQNT